MSKISKDKFTSFLIEQQPDCFFVNEDLDILYMAGDLEDFFTLPSAVARFNIEKMVATGQLSFFRQAIAKALSEDGIQRYKDITFGSGEDFVVASFTFEVVNVEEVNERVVLCKVFKNKTNDFSGKEEKKIVKENNLLKPDERIEKLENEIKHYQKELKKLEVEQKNRVEEINAQNRDMMASNEELQSTNEELQSVNEELHTVNAELQFKNKELTTANNDINNLLKSTDIGTIFLDEDFRIRKFTPAIRKQFDLIKSDVGRPISAFANHFNETNLEKLCHHVLDEGKPIRKLVTSQENEEFLMRILPYKTIEKKIIGIVITFVDLSKTKSMLQEFDNSIQETAHRLNAIVENSKNPLIFIDAKYKILDVNKSLGSLRISDMMGKRIDKLLPKKYQVEMVNKLKKIFSNDESQTVNVDFDEGEYSYRLNLIPIQDYENIDEVGSACIIATENTDTMTYLRTLEQTKETYMSFMENAQHQMVLLDKDGIIVNINSTRKSPYTAEQLIGSCIYEQLPPSEVAQYKSSIEKIFGGGSQSKIGFKYVSMEKEVVDVSVIASPVVVGERIAYVALVGDPI